MLNGIIHLNNEDLKVETFEFDAQHENTSSGYVYNKAKFRLVLENNEDYIKLKNINFNIDFSNITAKNCVLFEYNNQDNIKNLGYIQGRVKGNIDELFEY